MKKILFLMLSLMATINTMADSSVKSGDVKVLKDASATFSVEFDFTNTKVEGKPYKEYLASRNEKWNRDCPNDIQLGINTFIENWNKKNKKGMQATSNVNAPYKLVIKPSYISFGSTALAWTIGFGAGGMKMSGTMELYKGSAKVLTIDVVDQTGKSMKTETKRFKSLMQELADDTYKDIMK